MADARQERRTVGRYSLLSKIASGGMGEVHLAKMDSMEGVEKLFAIKLLLPHFAEDQSVVDMFITEARIAARITHPNVCQVFELGVEKKELFICMEYLQGIPATSILKAHKPLNPVRKEIAVAIIMQVCAGLQFAHNIKGEDGEPLGVVHRDISPGNIFITTAGTAKILDFGVVKAKDASYKTRTGALKGKFGYMSPEQIMAQPLDSRSDIFSLGICLFELLTNRRLFTRESEYATLKAITEAPIVKLRAVRPDLPEALEEVLSKALARDVDERFQSMRDFSRALSGVMKNYGGVADATELADYVEGKFTYQLGQIEEMLEAVREAPTFNPELAHSGAGSDDPELADDAIEPDLVTADIPVLPAPSPRRSPGMAIAVGVVGVGVIAVAVALLMMMKKDEAAPVTAGIVYEGKLTPDKAGDGRGPVDPTKAAALSAGQPDADTAIPPDASPVDAAATRPRAKKHRCEKKPTAEARNRCYVSSRGRKLTKCLSDHAVEISGSPQLILSFDLASSGKVMAVSVAPAAVASSPLGACVKRVADKIRFGPQEGEIRFRIPLKINQR